MITYGGAIRAAISSRLAHLQDLADRSAAAPLEHVEETILMTCEGPERLTVLRVTDRLYRCTGKGRAGYGLTRDAAVGGWLAGR